MEGLNIKGIICAILTPFTKNGKEIDHHKLKNLTEFLINKGVHGLFVGGTTGEGLVMSIEERKELLESVVKLVDKRCMVIAHTGTFNLTSTIELTAHAVEQKASGAGIVTPGYYYYDEEALYRYYSTIAKEFPRFPILLYNIPSCARNFLSNGLILKLAKKYPNIVGIKDSTGNMVNLSELLGSKPVGFVVINGVDEYGYQAFLAGVQGAVSGTANVAPELYLGVYDNCMKRRLPEAWIFQTQLTKLCQTLQYGKNLGMFKYALKLRGIDVGYVRPPHREPTPLEKKEIENNLRKLNLI
ncbi:MAG: dihydrodipicolinate synthase family protein [Candidatus Hydrogenedentes bacterium]|nr:dihydrodipicolinate synthase family protein [Candidatus Hydrogenedentota bacterium]